MEERRTYIDADATPAADPVRAARAARDARRAAAREAVRLIGPATELHRRTQQTTGADQPKGIRGAFTGERRPGDTLTVDDLAYTRDVIDLAAWIAEGQQ